MDMVYQQSDNGMQCLLCVGLWFTKRPDIRCLTGKKKPVAKWAVVDNHKMQLAIVGYLAFDALANSQQRDSSNCNKRNCTRGYVMCKHRSIVC